MYQSAILAIITQIYHHNLSNTQTPNIKYLYTIIQQKSLRRLLFEDF